MNLFVLLEQAALRFPGHPAVCVGTDVSLVYAELASRALRLGAGMRERYREGDRVAIVTENRSEYVELLFGVWAAGMVAVPINAKLHAREVAQIVDDAGAAAVFVSPALAARITDALRAAAPALRATVIGGSEYGIACAHRRCKDRRRWRPTRLRGSSTPAERPADRKGPCFRTGICSR